MVHVWVDYEALMRGHTLAGEHCEVPGLGPVPVTLAQDRAGDRDADAGDDQRIEPVASRQTLESPHESKVLRTRPGRLVRQNESGSSARMTTPVL